MRISEEQGRHTAAGLLQAGGMTAEQARAVAGKLVESDLLGHRTHGLAMLPVYLERLADGRIRVEGCIDVVADSAAAFTWEANRLPGAWVMGRAVDQLLARVSAHPVVTASIANCTHIGALQAYFEPIAERKLMALMMVTDPGVASVAPFGGADPVLTSNPIGACIPTHNAPILIDQSTSVVSNAAIGAHSASGTEVPEHWILDGQGAPTRDPAAISADPPGTIMPLGGPEFGYKGFGFGILVEAFALALAGYGRNEPRVRGGQGVFLQIIDPDGFCGAHRFLDETTEFVRRCKSSRPAQGSEGVRLPGERALENKREQREKGIAIAPELLQRIDQWAQRLGVPEVLQR